MPADRPYQSHLLSFLNRQLQNAKDKTGMMWRSVKLSASTALRIGLQAIMYPIYAVIKAAELVGKQIKATTGTMGWLRSGQSTDTSNLVHLTSDSPLANVLTALTQRQIAQTTVGSADELTIAFASGLTIQGVASRLSDRRIALVTSDQQVLDLLSDSQEAQLQHRIRYEIALYLRWVRSRTLHSFASQSLVAADRSSSIQGGWIQRIWTRSFWTQRFLGSPKQNNPLTSEPQLKLTPITIPTLWTSPSSSLGFFSLPNLQDLPNLQELPNLIQAALRYFFGPSRKYYVRGENQTSLTIEPWFTFEALWGETPIATLQDPNSDRTLSPTPAIPLIVGTATHPLIKPRIISRSTATIAVTKAANNFSPAQKHNTTSANIIKRPTASTKHCPDWLDAKSVDLGYKKNWADHCIGWLDWILVRIEQIFLTIWQSLVTLFHSR